MKYYASLFLMLLFCSCKDVDTDEFRLITVSPYERISVEQGVSFHNKFTTSDPVYFTGIQVNDLKLEVGSEVYENPPFEIVGDGIKGIQHDSKTIEILVSGDLELTEGEHCVVFDLSPIRLRYNESLIWWVNDIVITRTQPAE
ncbi:MAG: hypothetical protein E7137_07900 [Rikenellaceae bacterium]|nr:hypothetical protein [Rikenellaceae bacterium]